MTLLYEQNSSSYNTLNFDISKLYGSVLLFIFIFKNYKLFSSKIINFKQTYICDICSYDNGHFYCFFSHGENVCKHY